MTARSPARSTLRGPPEKATEENAIRIPRNCQHVCVTVTCGMCCIRFLFLLFCVCLLCCAVFMWCVCFLVSSCDVLCAVHVALRACLRASYLMAGPSMPMDGAPRPRTDTLDSFGALLGAKRGAIPSRPERKTCTLKFPNAPVLASTPRPHAMLPGT